MTEERLRDIRKLNELHPMGCEVELLAEIDTLRAELAETKEKWYSSNRTKWYSSNRTIVALESELSRLREAAEKVADLALHPDEPSEPWDSLRALGNALREKS